MIKEAYKQAHEEFSRARAALERLRGSDLPTDQMHAYCDVLEHSAIVYNKLKRGTKGDAKSTSWFEKQKHIRHADPLLNYVHHARNTKDHGISPFATLHPPIVIPEPHTEKYIFTDEDGQQSIQLPVHDIAFTVNVPPRALELCPVFDERGGQTYAVPVSHLGKPIENISPERICELLIEYLQGLLCEARRFLTA